jgi:hypothetical protein
MHDTESIACDHLHPKCTASLRLYSPQTTSSAREEGGTVIIRR